MLQILSLIHIYQLIVELKTQLNESLTLNEKLNKENRAGNIPVSYTHLNKGIFLIIAYHFIKKPN